jgi:hypothetical protein
LGVAQADSSLAAAIRAMEAEDENTNNTADPVDAQVVAETPTPTPKAEPTPPVTPKVAAKTTATAAVTTAATTGVVPAPDKRAAATWLIFCIGGGAVVWGGVLVFTSLRQRRLSAILRTSIAAAHHDEELLHERMADLDVLSNELRAERDELLATRRLLTGEFEKLKTLLGRQTEELRSTDTALQHGDEILQRQLVAAEAPATATSNAGETLDSVRREFAVQQQRLGTLQETMDQRDRELIDTCAKMDARLEEVLQKVSLIDVFDEPHPGGGDDNSLSDADNDGAANAMAEWDERHAQIQELENQFDSDTGEPSPESNAMGTSMADETLITATAVETDYDGEHVTEELKQKWAARTELNSLREVANQSTRTVLANYSRKKMLRSKLLLASLGLFGICFALVSLLGGLGSNASQASLGWGALGTGSVAVILLGSSLLQHRRKS